MIEKPERVSVAIIKIACRHVEITLMHMPVRSVIKMAARKFNP